MALAVHQGRVDGAAVSGNGACCTLNNWKSLFAEPAPVDGIGKAHQRIECVPAATGGPAIAVNA